MVDKIRVYAGELSRVCENVQKKCLQVCNSTADKDLQRAVTEAAFDVFTLLDMLAAESEAFVPDEAKLQVRRLEKIAHVAQLLEKAAKKPPGSRGRSLSTIP